MKENEEFTQFEPYIEGDEVLKTLDRGKDSPLEKSPPKSKKKKFKINLRAGRNTIGEMEMTNDQFKQTGVIENEFTHDDPFELRKSKSISPKKLKKKDKKKESVKFNDQTKADVSLKIKQSDEME